mgnify:FL=1
MESLPALCVKSAFSEQRSSTLRVFAYAKLILHQKAATLPSGFFLPPGCCPRGGGPRSSWENQMAYLATVQLLIDAETESSATGIAQELVSQMHANGSVLDFSVDDVRTVKQTINEQIADGTYVMGECFSNYLVVSKAKRDPEASYWSNTFGWTDYNLATRFDALVDRLPTGLTDNEAAFLLDRGPEQMSQLLAAR